MKGLDVLFRALATGDASEAIEHQEARGQQALVVSDMLPTEVHGEARAKLESLGVVFKEIVPDDPLFQSVTLPAGWVKRPTDHAMWSELVDAEGVVQATIFYKAAFYDRRAFMSL